MEAEDMDPLALAFYSVLCSWGRIIDSKPKRNWFHPWLKKKNPDWCYIWELTVELVSIWLRTRQDYNLFWAATLMDADLWLNGLCFYNFQSIWCPNGAHGALECAGIDMQQAQGQSLLFPWKPPATDRHVSPPEPCWSEHTTEHLFTNNPDGAVLTLSAHPPPTPHHLIPQLGPDGRPYRCSLLSSSRTNHEEEWPAGTAPGAAVPLTADHPLVASNVSSCQKTNCPTDCSFMNSPCGPFLKRG